MSRSRLNYRPKPVSEEDLSLMGQSDRQYLETPLCGSRRMKAWLERRGPVSRKRVQRLMRIMRSRTINRRPSTSRPAAEHRVFPYLLKNAGITRPNQVWAADITFRPMALGVLYLVSIIDRPSRYMVSWRLTNTLEPDFRIDALDEALARGSRRCSTPTREGD